MSGLRALQEAFQAYIVRRDETMLGHVVSTADADARLRLEVYAHAYRARLLEALQADYPGLHALLGDARFERLGASFIDAHPSAHPSIRWFGSGLAAHLASAAPWCEQPLLSEFARFEWAQGLAFDAADADPVTLERLARFAPGDWPALAGTLHPSVRFLDLHWNVPQLWLALDAAVEPPAPQRSDSALRWLIWRKGLDPHWRSLEADEAWALGQLGAGQVFGEICEGLAEWLDPEHIAIRAAGLLKQWATDGLLSELGPR